MVKPTDPRGWIGVDLDGTLADYTEGFKGNDHIGAPVPAMFERVKRWLMAGRQVRIFTARIHPITEMFTLNSSFASILDRYGDTAEVRDAYYAGLKILDWTNQYFDVRIPVTCVKDKCMIELYDDRCVQVLQDTGILVGRSSRGVTV